MKTELCRYTEPESRTHDALFNTRQLESASANTSAEQVRGRFGPSHATLRSCHVVQAVNARWSNAPSTGYLDYFELAISLTNGKLDRSSWTDLDRRVDVHRTEDCGPICVTLLSLIGSSVVKSLCISPHLSFSLFCHEAICTTTLLGAAIYWLRCR